MVKFFDQNNILNEKQHGFRKGLSTITAVTEFTNTAINLLDEGN